MGRQPADKTHRVGQKNLVLPLEPECANSRIEGCKQARGCFHPTASKGIKERGFPGVGVADQRNHAPVALAAVLAMQGPLRPHSLDGLPHLPDSRAQTAAIELELLLARSTRPDSTSEPRKQRASPSQARQEVIELGQLNLKLALAGARPPREDVENKLGPVDDLEPECQLEVAELGGGEVVLEDDTIRTRAVRQSLDVSNLSASEQRSGVRMRRVLHRTTKHLAAGARGQLRQLFKRLLVLAAPRRRQPSSPTGSPGGQINLLQRISGMNRASPLETKWLTPHGRLPPSRWRA